MRTDPQEKVKYFFLGGLYKEMKVFGRANPQQTIWKFSLRGLMYKRKTNMFQQEGGPTRESNCFKKENRGLLFRRASP
jgi:hypothetical protein